MIREDLCSLKDSIRNTDPAATRADRAPRGPTLAPLAPWVAWGLGQPGPGTPTRLNYHKQTLLTYQSTRGGGAGWGLTKEVSMHAASGRGGGGPWVAGDAHRRLHRLGQAGVLLLELELLLSLLQRGMPSSRVHGASCACNIHGAWVARVWSMQRSMPAARERSGRRRRAPPVWPPRC